MTGDVITTRPEALLVERGISGLPVCDHERHVIGVISESRRLRA